jgi:hypothetical protein
MPIVVDEVVISVEVAAPKEAGPAGKGALLARKAGPDQGGGGGGSQAVVQECVERVLEILARREER